MTGSPEEALVSLLRTPTLQQFFGDRFHADVMPPDGRQPALVYTMISSDDAHSLDGRVGRERINYQLDIIASTKRESVLASIAVRDRIVEADESFGGYRLTAGRIENRQADYDRQTKTYRQIIDAVLSSIG